MQRVFAISGMLFLVFATQAAADCTCRFRGGETVEGQTACISTSSGSTLARCEKFLNNTSWKMLNQPCPTASLSGPDGDMSPADPVLAGITRG